MKENKILDMAPYMKSITEILMLNISFMDNIGLLNGKMGVSIFFFHLSRLTKNTIFEEYANGLLEEIQEEISHATPIGFSDGLAGIGFGIEYLIQNGFIIADPDEVLEELDHSMFMQLVFNTPKSIGLLNGLTGLGLYLLKRIKNTISNDENISTLKNKQTLIHLIDELDRKTQDIDEIIKEPQFVSENKQPSPVVSNTQDVKLTKFDIIWDYPVLICFLVELYDQNIFNFKVETIIERLIAPIIDRRNWPVRGCNRLLLALSIKKFEQCISTSIDHGLTEKKIQFGKGNDINPKTLGTICSNLLSGIDRKIVKSEIISNNATIRQGCFGLAWLYSELYILTENAHHWEESKYWSQQGLDIWQNIVDLSSMDSKDHDGAMGILDGLSGIGLGVFNFFRPNKA